MKCKCKEDKGRTTIACCNECGLPIKTEPWEFIGIEFIERIFDEYEYDDEHFIITPHIENIKNLLIGEIESQVKI